MVAARRVEWCLQVAQATRNTNFDQRGFDCLEQWFRLPRILDPRPLLSVVPISSSNSRSLLLVFSSMSSTNPEVPTEVHSPPPTTSGEEAKTNGNLATTTTFDIDDQIARVGELLETLHHLKRTTGTASLSVPLPSTPNTATPTTARRPLPFVPLAPVSATQAPVVKRSLGFHAPESLRAPHVTASPVPSASQDVLSSTPILSGTDSPRLRPLKGKEPDKFGGTEQERVSARRWLRTARNWLKLAARGEEEETMVDMFATLLKGAASDWFYHLQETAERKGVELTLQTVFDEFVLKYEGGVSRVLLQQELDNLVYRKGPCRDIYAADAEFDRLVGMLYPNFEEDSQAMPLLAKVYSDIFRQGDLALWTEAVKMRPETVDEWKAAIQRAHTIQQIVASANRPAGRGGSSWTRPSSFPPSSVSSSSPSCSGSSRVAAASVNEMQGRAVSNGEKGETYTWERQEGEPDALMQPEHLQQVSTRTARGPRAPSTAGGAAQGSTEVRRRYGNHLTFEERVGLLNAGRCWNCCEKGHLAAKCPSLDKPGYPRKPRADQLKE